MAEASGGRFPVDVEGLRPGQIREVTVGGRALLLCNVEGELFAVEDRCPHQDVPLGHGRMRGALIECPLHGGRFDVRTGQPTRAPTRACMTTFAVHRGPGGVEVEL